MSYSMIKLKTMALMISQGPPIVIFVNFINKSML